MNRNVVIAAEHPVMCMALSLILRNIGFEVIAQAHNGMAALNAVEALHPSIFIIDLGISGGDGFSVIHHVVANGWPVKIIVLTGHDSPFLAMRCLHSGVHGYVSKQQASQVLISAVEAVHRGQTYFPPGVSILGCNGPPDKVQQRLESLSSRELRVLQLLVQGMSYKEIAGCMLLSKKTVSTYKARLMHKLKVDNLLELFNLAMRHGLV